MAATARAAAVCGSIYYRSFVVSQFPGLSVASICIGRTASGTRNTGRWPGIYPGPFPSFCMERPGRVRARARAGGPPCKRRIYCLVPGCKCACRGLLGTDLPVPGIIRVLATWSPPISRPRFSKYRRFAKTRLFADVYCCFSIHAWQTIIVINGSRTGNSWSHDYRDGNAESRSR